MKFMEKISQVIRIVFLSLSLLIMGCEGNKTPAEHLNQAENFLDKGEYKAAVIELKNILQQSPKHARARYLLGELYLKLEDGVSAEKELNWARELGVVDESVVPQLAQALLLQDNYLGVLDLGIDQVQQWGPKAKANFLASRGLALLALERKDEALDAVDGALGADGASTYALLVKARIVAAGGKIEEARTVLDRAFEIDEGYGPAWSFLGDIERFEGNLESAEAAYGKAIKYKQVAYTDLLNRGMILIALKKFDEAEEDIDQLARLIKRHPDVDYAKGLLHFQRKEYADAQTAFEKVLTVNNDYLSAVLYAGAAHFMQGHQETAESYLSRYVGRIPNYLPASRMLALIKLRKKDFKTAERLIRNAVGEDDMDVFTLTLLANSLMGQNRVPEAMVYFQRVVAIQPESANARFDLGLGLLRQGEKEAGIAALEATVELDPALQQAAVQLVVIYLNNQEFDKALEAALNYRDQNGDVSAHLLLGVVYMARNEVEEAATAFQRALELDPGNTSASSGLAIIAMKSKQWEKAEGYYRDALEKHPEHLQTLLNLASVEAAQGNVDAMKSALESAIQYNPEALQPRLVLGRVNLEEKNPDKTLDLLSGFKEKYQNDLELLTIVAEAEIKTGNWSKANSTVSRIIELKPNNALWRYQLARVKANLGDADAYRDELQKTLEAAPDHTEARIALANLMLKEGEKDAADEQIQILKKQTDNSAEALVLEGKLAEMSGNIGLARDSYQEAFDKAKNNFNLLRVSNAKWEMGNRSEAVKVLEAWLKDYPQDDLVRLELANRYLTLERPAEARETYREIIKSSPNNVMALNNISWLLQDTKPDEALQFAYTASTLAPQSVEVKDTLAMALMSSGDAAQAQRVIEKVLVMRPDNLTFRYHKAVILNKLGKSAEASAELKAIIARNDEFPEKQEAEKLYRAIGGM